MKTRLLMTMLIAMMSNAVIFGAGAIAILTIPSLQERAMALMPWIVIAAFTIGPLIAWFLAPAMLARRGEQQPGSVRPAAGELIAAE